ncbi:MAG: ribbon-helix-helix protein, CopG family [Anaerolineaceae bacterium]|nr:ribbon-helix-helix protein, CopG family [Anaerolineaceae bacterium]
MKKDILVRTQILLEPEQLKALTQLAEEQGKSVSALLREWVSAGLHSQRQKKLAEAALLLSEAYYSDGDLVGYSKLDGEDFFMQGQG